MVGLPGVQWWCKLRLEAIASSNKCIATSTKKLLVTRASLLVATTLLVARALLLVARTLVGWRPITLPKPLPDLETCFRPVRPGQGVVNPA